MNAKQNKTVVKLTLSAMFLAIGLVLPFFTGQIPQIGNMLLPMHIPVLLCGLVCGWPYGAFCGVVGPLLSSVVTGMPPAAALVHMLPELCVYGLACGLLAKLIHTGNLYGDLYCALIPAMLLGRIAGGAARALFLLGGGQSYSLTLWVSAYLVEALPGIVLHLILVPALVVVLTKAGLVPARSARRMAGEGAAA